MTLSDFSNHLSSLFSGFSIFVCLIFLCAYLFYLPDMRKSLGGKISCTMILVSIMTLQIAHYSYFNSQVALLEHRAYSVLLMIIPPAFYFFSRATLYTEVTYKPIDLTHAIALMLALLLPIKVLPPVSFMLGTAYTFWFARLVYNLRNQSGRFKFEMFFFGMFAIMALGALILGLALPSLDPHIFYTAYANAISIALLSILAALLFFPELLNDIQLITELAYAKSKLKGIDIEGKISQLDQLMTTDKHYQNEDLNITQLAELLDLSSHQLSELINSHFGFGFPRYVRHQRVKEAKVLLINEPNSSILSISMETGFKSQSNFYTAFKEITGVSPGHFRKNTLNL